MPGLARVDRDRVAERPGERLELGLHDVVRLAAGEHPHVQRDVGVERERLEDVPGQRAEVGRPRRRRRARRTPGPRARRCARSRDGRTRRRRPAPAPRRAARWRRRTGGCPACRRAPRAAPGRARSRCPRRCGGRRCGCRRRSATVRSTSECRANEIEHVVVEADAGRDVVAAGAVEVDLDEDLGLAGLPLDACGPGSCRAPSISLSTSVRASLERRHLVGRCRSTPAATRPGPTSRISTPRSSSPCHTA